MNDYRRARLRLSVARRVYRLSGGSRSIAVIKRFDMPNALHPERIAKFGTCSQPLLLRRAPAPKRSLVLAHLSDVKARDVPALVRITHHIEEPRASGVQLGDEFHRTVSQADHPQRVVSEEQRHARLVVQDRLALRDRRCPDAHQVERRGCRVDEADDALAADLFAKQARRGNEKRHADILVVELKRMAEVAFVLAERFTVIA